MIYKDFCIQSETAIDEEFIEQEMDFLIKVSIWDQQQIKDKEEYAKIVKARYSNWLNKDISYG